MSGSVPAVPESPAAFINRELSWLSFAGRVLALAEDQEQPLLERVKFAGIMGMICDEFAMKRIGGLLRQVRAGASKHGPDGLAPAEVLEACRAELRSQQESVAELPGDRGKRATATVNKHLAALGDFYTWRSLGPPRDSRRMQMVRYRRTGSRARPAAIAAAGQDGGEDI